MKSISPFSIIDVARGRTRLLDDLKLVMSFDRNLMFVDNNALFINAYTFSKLLQN